MLPHHPKHWRFGQDRRQEVEIAAVPPCADWLFVSGVVRHWVAGRVLGVHIPAAHESRWRGFFAFPLLALYVLCSCCAICQVDEDGKMFEDEM